jgi:hypothetical protein
VQIDGVELKREAPHAEWSVLPQLPPRRALHTRRFAADEVSCVRRRRLGRCRSPTSCPSARPGLRDRAASRRRARRRRR